MARCDQSSSLACFLRYGSRLIIAGSSVTEYSQAAAMPTAVIFPRCQYGGESEKLSDRNPTIVVREVIDTGRKLTRTASTSAVDLSSPSRIRPRSDSRM